MEAPAFIEEYLTDIHQLLICGAQIARIPVNADVPVATRTVSSPRAAHPLVIDTPAYVTHMPFGVLSKETKIALTNGSCPGQNRHRVR